jgi:transposase
MFQHDNEQPHVAMIWTQFLEAEHVLPCPAYSPDMSPIEYVWDALDSSVRQRSSSRQYPATLLSHRRVAHSTVYNQQPDQLYVKEMCRAA